MDYYFVVDVLIFFRGEVINEFDDLGFVIFKNECF